MNQSNNINSMYNIKLILFSIFCWILDYLFKPQTTETVLWDKFFPKAPELNVSIAVFLFVVVVIISYKLLFEFWNKFISDIFKIRFITHHEALSIVLLMLLFVWG
jgi:hypothetical protein